MRLELHRGDQGVHATATNQFVGRAFFSKTIGPVVRADIKDNSRDRRSDSIKERQRRARQKRMVLTAEDGSNLSWGRESDTHAVSEFLRGPESDLVLTDDPPLWRSILSWIGVGLGLLTCLGALKQLIPVAK